MYYILYEGLKIESNEPVHSILNTNSKDFAKQRYNTPYACNVI